MTTEAFQHQDLGCSSLSPFCPANRSPLYLFPIPCFRPFIQMCTFPHPHPSTPTPLHIHTFQHPYLPTIIISRTLNYPSFYFNSPTTSSAYVLSICHCTTPHLRTNLIIRDNNG